MAFTMPALDGREPLGFLAAIGTLNLVADHVDPQAQLCFDSRTGQAMLMSSQLRSVDTLVSAISEIVAGLGEAVVPGMPASFPPPGAAPDGLRVPPAQLADLVSMWQQEADDPQVVMRWVRGLVTDLAVDREGRAAITPLAAPSGKQSFSTMFVKSREALELRPSAISEAFLGWRRVPGCTGEYLDHRVLMSSADAPTQRDARERGVPGATWLALMALPMFPVTAYNGRRAAVGWQTIRRQLVMRWPLWSRGADVTALPTLLSHPALQLGDLQDLFGRTSEIDRLRRIGVFAVVIAARQRVPGRKSEGVLVPQRVIGL